MAARNQERATEAMERIRGGVPEARLTLVPLDLGSLDSVQAAAEQILAAHETIDLLVNNAGVMGIPRAAHRRRLRDAVRRRPPRPLRAHRPAAAGAAAAPAARVVTVTSTAHHMGRAVNPDNPNLDGRYGPWRAYGQAKLANFHFGLGLHRLLREAGAPAASLVAHPGLSNTELQAVSVEETGGGLSQRFFLVLARTVGMSPGEGALSQLRAATDPGAKERRVLRPALRQQRPAGAQAGAAPRHEPRDRAGSGRSPSAKPASSCEA